MENRKKEHPHKYTTTKTHIRNATENGPTRPDYYVATAFKKKQEQQQSYVTQSIRCRWNVAVVAVVCNFSEILYRNVITTYADSRQHHSKRHLTALSSVHSATLLIKKRQQPNETNPPHTHHQQPTNQPTDWLTASYSTAPRSIDHRRQHTLRRHSVLRVWSPHKYRKFVFVVFFLDVLFSKQKFCELKKLNGRRRNLIKYWNLYSEML